MFRCAAIGLALVVMAASGALPLQADSLELIPAADTTLIETSPGNNMGGTAYVNAGTTQNFTRNRGLFRFAVAEAIPAGSIITSVTLYLEVTRHPRDGFAAARFDLHRVLVSWGEGTRLPANPDAAPGLGAPAAPGEATWTHRFFDTTNEWAGPGGAAGIDYATNVSGQVAVFGTGESPYGIPSTERLIEDVQLWLDRPEVNFGWLLKADNENRNFTARRFGSREEEVFAPLLTIGFQAPGNGPRLSGRLEGGQLRLTFPVAPRVSYRVDRAALLAPGAWQGFTNFPPPLAAGAMEVAVPASDVAAFFRLVALPEP